MDIAKLFEHLETPAKRRPGRPRTAIDPGNPNPSARVASLSPRVRRGLALYASAACKTKKEASEAVGLSPTYLTMLTTVNPLARRELKRIMDEVDDANIDVAKVLHQLSVNALTVIERTMHEAGSEALRLKAAQDLADRGPQTGKVQRHQVESWHVDPAEAKLLAAAMLEAAEVRQSASHVLSGSHDATGVSTPAGDEPSV